VTLERLIERIEPWLAEAEGVTISGGEPFDQADALHALLMAVRERTTGDILVYSGHAFETIAPLVAAMDGLIDTLISDPLYRRRAADAVAARQRQSAYALPDAAG